MKSKEIMEKIKDKRAEARAKMDAGDMTAARALAEEVRGLEEDLETALSIEEGELRDSQGRGVQCHLVQEMKQESIQEKMS